MSERPLQEVFDLSILRSNLALNNKEQWIGTFAGNPDHMPDTNHHSDPNPLNWPDPGIGGWRMEYKGQATQTSTDYNEP